MTARSHALVPASVPSSPTFISARARVRTGPPTRGRRTPWEHEEYRDGQTAAAAGEPRGHHAGRPRAGRRGGAGHPVHDPGGPAARRQGTSLYAYVSGRDEIVDGLHALVVAERDLADATGPWTEVIDRWARSYRAAFAARPGRSR